MKRPLLWAVVSFALGEVISLFADSILRKSIIVIMLICGVIFIVSRLKRGNLRMALILFLCCMAGFLNVYMRDAHISYPDDMKADCSGVVYMIKENDEGFDLYLHLEYGFNVVAFGTDGLYRIGDIVRVEGTLKAFSHNSNPGCFDFKDYYKAQNILFSVSNKDISFVADDKSHIYKYLNFLFDLKLMSKEKMYEITDEKTAGIYCGILLGNRKSVDDITKLDYQNNGIAHILAISGLHISLIFGILYKLLRRLRVNRYVAGGLAFLIIFSYALMTGFSMSTLRALCMILLSLVAVYTGDTYDMPVALSTAVLVILLYNPFKLTDSSVILSVTAIIGVCVGRYILKHLNYFYYINTWKKKFFASVIMSFSVNIVMLPVVICIYHEVTLYSIFLNLIVIPLMTVVFVSGIMGLLCAYISVGVAAFVIKPGEMILKFYDALCAAFYRLPFARINIGRIYIYQIELYYIMLILLLALLNKRFVMNVKERIYKKHHIWFSFKKWRFLCVIYALLVSGVCFGTCIYTYEQSCGELVAFIDVGQGDGILIRSRSGLNMIIDGGSTSNDELGRYVMIPVIKYFGMAHIDYWFISHTDRDHISGLLYILDMGERSGIKIDNLVFSYAMKDEAAFRDILALAEKNSIKVMFMETGDYVTDESFEIMCTHPDRLYKTDDINDASLCLSYISEDCSVLFTGDMGDDALGYMILNERDYLLDNYDILKVPHHGSRNSINLEFYNQIDFENAVISCAHNSIYGHPHEEVLEYLDSYSCIIYRTDQQGAVSFSFNQGKVGIDTYYRDASP